MAGRGTWAAVLSVRNTFRILNRATQHSVDLLISVLTCMSIYTVLKIILYKALWLLIYLIVFTYLFFINSGINFKGA